MKIIECPRDALQGLQRILPTAAKASYINRLLHAGFDTIDFGSFVSPKAIPQMADTAEVLEMLDLSATSTKLLAIIANEQGAKAACRYKEITYLGFPFSVSETFQLRNTHASIAESLERVKAIHNLCKEHGKEPVIYISMGFGNPYGDEWNEHIVLYWVEKLHALGIRTFSIADTVGVAMPQTIGLLYGKLCSVFPDLEFGAHFHTTADNWREKIAVAYAHSVRRFDTAILGFGGCPMAGNALVGNLPTDKLLTFLHEKQHAAAVTTETIHELETAFQHLISSECFSSMKTCKDLQK